MQRTNTKDVDESWKMWMERGEKMMLNDESTCEEWFYLEDEEGNVTSLWFFKNENIVRAYRNGHHLHNDIKTDYLEPLPKFAEV